MTAWECDLIRRVDDAVLPVINAVPGTETSQIPMSNGKAVMGLFKGIAARKRAEKNVNPQTKEA